MVAEQAGVPQKSASWGWRLLLIVSAFLALNGAGLYFMSGSPAIFEQDTGVPYAEVQAVYPTVAEHIVGEGQIISVLLIVVGLMAGTASVAGMRQGSRWAWWMTGIVLAMLVYYTLRFMLAEGRPDIGGFYGAAAVIALIGQWLARPSASE